MAITKFFKGRRWLTVASGLVLVGLSALSWAQMPGENGDADIPADPAVAEAVQRLQSARTGSEKVIRLRYVNAGWATVLNDVAAASGLTLVMDKVPPGRFSRWDRSENSLTETLRVLNRELEPKFFRAIKQGEFLVVLPTKKTRVRYRRPTVSANRPEPQRIEFEAPEYEHRSETIVGAGSEEIEDGTGRPSTRKVQHAAHEQEPPHGGENSTPQRIAVQLQNNSATNVSRAIYEGFKPRAELLDRGPDGLPAFQVLLHEVEPVHRAAPRRRIPVRSGVLFQVGIDTQSNALVIEAPHPQAAAIAGLARLLDARPPRPGEALRVAPSKVDARVLAQQLRPVVSRLSVAQADDPFVNAAQPPQPPNDRAVQPPNGMPQPDAANPQAIIGGLRGEVVIEDVPGVGLVLRGNEEDVEKVMEVIRRIEAMSIGAAPSVRLHPLQFIQSQALADLLNNVYTTLSTAPGRLVQQTQTVQVVPVVKPNAVLVLASEDDMQAVLALIEQLDQPVDPRTEFTVFRLRNAVATQVVTMLNDFYQTTEEQRPGLAPRVRAVADARTNSVVVQAAPRDLDEVATLIQKIDEDQSAAVQIVKVFPLRSAVAEELANVINQAIFSVLNPPTLPGQAGQFAGAQAAAGAGVNQQLREAKSAVLQFLAVDGERQEIVRSGILTDIRVTPDPRTNSLIVTAPRDSMELMAALIDQFDRPAPQVAEIKVFTLANADATAAAELLQELLVQPAQQAGQQGQLGIQIAGAEDASSALIPLRFSVDVRTNSILAVGGADALDVVDAILLRLDEADFRQRQNKVIRLKNSFAPDVAAAITEFRASLRNLETADPDLISSYEQLEREIVVVADAASNNLLISATPKYFPEILRIVNELDAAPAQVIIQALLVEVVLEDIDEFGIELGFQDSVLFNRSTTLPEDLLTITETVLTPSQGGAVQTTTQRIISQAGTPGFLFNSPLLGNNIGSPNVNPSDVGAQGLSNFAVGRVNSELGFGGLVLSAHSESVSILLRALAQQRHVEILSRPQIRTLDNQFSQIHVGQDVPIVRGVTGVGQFGVSASPLIDIAQTGILLEVTPRITPEGIVVMQVVATKSALTGDGVPIFTDATTGNVIESPILDVTTAQTTVAVPNNQTVVLGGMITNDNQQLTRKVPWLGDLPVIGKAFRYESKSNRRTELLIFLTPRIVRDDMESELIKQIEAERIHFTEQLAEEIHGPLFAVPADGELLNCPPGMMPVPGGGVMPIPGGEVVPPPLVPVKPLPVPAPPASVPPPPPGGPMPLGAPPAVDGAAYSSEDEGLQNNDGKLPPIPTTRHEGEKKSVLKSLLSFGSDSDRKK